MQKRSHRGGPPTDTLFYDGKCGFCRRSARRLEQLQQGGLSLVPIDETETEQGMPGRLALQRQLHVKTAQGQWLTGLDAVLKAWSHTRWAWLFKPLGWPLIHAPAAAFYDAWELARYRRLHGCGECSGEDD
jgi:predicted DCC family thiol-disulfide oxidoreductase YuxK